MAEGKDSKRVSSSAIPNIISERAAEAAPLSTRAATMRAVDEAASRGMAGSVHLEGAHHSALIRSGRFMHRYGKLMEIQKKMWWPWSIGKALKFGPTDARKFSLKGSFGRSNQASATLPASNDTGQRPSTDARMSRPASLDINTMTPEIERYLRGSDTDFEMVRSCTRTILNAEAPSEYGDEEDEAAPVSPTIRRVRSSASSSVLPPGPRGSESFAHRLMDSGKRHVFHKGSHPTLRMTTDAHRRMQYSHPTQSLTALPPTLTLPTFPPELSSPLVENFQDAVKDWQNSPKTPSPLADIGGRKKPKPVIDRLQHIRRTCDLPPLQPRGDFDRKHPHHNYDWHSTKVMCRNMHTQEAYRELFEVTKACYICGEPCCHYMSLKTLASIQNRGKALKQVAQTAQDKIDAILRLAPFGCETYETLMCCASCQLTFCSDCGGRCSDVFCSAVLCKPCLEADTKCPNH